MGDSIMLASGTGLQQVAVRLSEALGDDYGWIAAGVSGDTCADVLARWPAVADAGVTHLALMCGVNDARTGRTAAQAWADESALLNHALDAGVRVRLVKTLNFDGANDSSSSKVAMINTLREYQQAWCDARGLACADPALALQAGDVLRFHQGDYLHPDTQGSVIFVTILAAWPSRYVEGW